jgi:hypothetical protein
VVLVRTLASLYLLPFEQALLHQAVAKLGGIHAAATRLSVPVTAINHYLAGTNPVPEDVVQRAVDVVLEEAPSPWDSYFRAKL